MPGPSRKRARSPEPQSEHSYARVQSPEAQTSSSPQIESQTPKLHKGKFYWCASCPIKKQTKHIISIDKLALTELCVKKYFAL